MADWADIELFADGDLTALEAGLLSKIEGINKHAEVRDYLKARITEWFSDLQKKWESSNDDTSVLIVDELTDDDVENLRLTSVYYNLYLVFYGLQVDTEDLYARKAAEYKRRYEHEFKFAMSRMRFNTDITDLDTNIKDVKLLR